ncbi:MAG: uroporphyrinogen-III synthase [Candidatus Helarchaeota archaeon]
MLKNKRIVITRPKEQQVGLKKLLEKEGAIVLSRPIIKIEEFRHARRIKQMINLILNKSADIIVFTSINGVNSVLKFAKKIGLFEKLKEGLRNLSVAAIGKKTAEQLESEGVAVNIIPHNYTSVDLAKSLIKKGVKNKRIFLLRANIATEDLPTILIENGATVVEFTVYKVVPEKIKNIRELINEILAGKIDIIIFTSAFSVNTLFGHTDRKSYQNLLDYAMENIKIVAIGPVTKNALTDLGFKVEITANHHTIEGIVQCLISYFNKSSESV